ncbi:uncharacterized protein B0H64DRAFT_358938 [Chaetomium fimeti]|uniref:Uncharacterized protein n=1 Tax=Chaetomium fimeti TaxID=1854472 RepID=A0AAE0LS23_9PEZI|nr:hypothetical protein B0H64DRAFT_358938 [Chaetomium fimeti]
MSTAQSSTTQSSTTQSSTTQSSTTQGCRPQPTSTSDGPLGTFGILNVQSRVMTPPRSLPLDNVRHEAAELLIDEIFGNEFEQKVFEVASRLDLRNLIAWVEITSRSSPATVDCMTCIALFKLGFDWLFDNPKTTKVNAGADIGACTPHLRDHKLADPVVGTLGCWLEIKVQDRGWEIVGLTNYHVVRPCLPGYHIILTSKELPISGTAEKDTALWKADRQGLKTDGTGQRVQVESPTRAKLNFSVKLNRDAVKEEIRAQEKKLGQGLNHVTARIADMEAREKGWLAFFNNQKHILGSVCFASGYLQRTSQNGRLDWALISPAEDGRVGQNLLPTMEDWRNAEYMRGYPRCIGGSITSPRQGTRSLHEMKKDDLVYKVGASTRCTIGEFDALKADCVIKEEKYMQGRNVDIRSTEFMFIGADGSQFARWGDSGSVVWDEDGRAVGLLFRGQSPGQSRGWFAYVTAIEDVFASIKATSGGKIEDIRFLGES